MNMFPDKNAYDVWQHLKEEYEPKGRKAKDNQKMKFVQCQLEPSKKVNDLLEKEVIDANANADGDEEEEACAIFGSNSRDGVKSEQSNKGKRQKLPMPSRQRSTSTAWNGKGDFENFRSYGGAKWDNDGPRKETYHHGGLYCRERHATA